ncbi:MAG: hypothetical protein ABFD96_09170, partial [Armatimonadia bacterium]
PGHLAGSQGHPKRRRPVAPKAVDPSRTHVILSRTENAPIHVILSRTENTYTHVILSEAKNPSRGTSAHPLSF